MTKTYGNYSDFITFTRASSATYMDSDGLIKTAATNAPRIEYDSNGIRKGLLIEEARTNLALYSDGFDNAYWVKTASGTGVVPVVTENYAISPRGSADADMVQFDSGSAGLSQMSSPGVSFTVGTDYTFSIWMRSLAGDVLVTMFNNSATKNVTVTSSWQRFTFTSTASLSVDTVRLAKRDVWGTAGTADILVWGAQLEAGSFPTSYIPTTGATAIRAADVASIPTNAFGYNQKAGTVVVDFETQFGTTGFPRIWEIGNISTGVNRTLVYIGAGGSNIRVATLSNNVTAIEATVRTGPSPASGKLAFTFSDNDFVGVIDGESPVIDTSGSFTTPSIPRDTLKIGGSATSANDNMSGHIKSIQYYPRRLTNAQLQALTA